MRVRVKICGLTRIEDALAAIDAGADALGFNFSARSRRQVSPATAAAIVAALPPFVTTVGLFVDADAREIRAIRAQVPLALVQLHGDESEAQCVDAGMPYVKAVRVSSAVDGAALARCYASASAIQLDAAVPGQAGGTGMTFDWRWYPRGTAKPWILAGGLNAENVGAAVRTLRPYAVDVSSGVESAPGIKDHARMRAFCMAVRAAEQAQPD